MQLKTSSGRINSSWWRSTSNMGRPAVPLGSPSSTAAECAPAGSAQHTCAAAGCCARNAATTFCAVARSATGCTQPMNRLFLISSSLLLGVARDWGMGWAESHSFSPWVECVSWNRRNFRHFKSSPTSNASIDHLAAALEPGRYSFSVSEAVVRGELRPLEKASEDCALSRLAVPLLPRPRVADYSDTGGYLHLVR